MKKLSKLKIDSEKFLKNEELLTLRGGYGNTCCTCYNGYPIGDVPATNDYMCDQNCKNKYGPWVHGIYIC